MTHAIKDLKLLSMFITNEEQKKKKKDWGPSFELGWSFGTSRQACVRFWRNEKDRSQPGTVVVAIGDS